MVSLPLLLRHESVEEFCTRWKISELSLFGSVLRDDFHSSSDVDVLVSFSPDADWGLIDHVEMRDELQKIFGRKVDLVTRRSVEHSRNWIRRKAILESARPLYVAR
jgi:hypothetical protein